MLYMIGFFGVDGWLAVAVAERVERNGDIVRGKPLDRGMLA